MKFGMQCLALATTGFGIVLSQLPSVARAAEVSAATVSPSESRPHGDLLSVRVNGGLGGGGVGYAARAGAELEYWVLPTLGVAVTGALGWQGAPLFGDSLDTWFIGPGLVLRSGPGPLYLFGTAAFGAGGGHHTRATDSYSCEPDCFFCSFDCLETSALHGYGAMLGAGVMSRVGFVDLGGGLSVDIPLPDGGGSYSAVTANFIVGFSVPQP